MAKAKERPLGLLIIVVLGTIGAVLGILASLAMLFMGSLVMGGMMSGLIGGSILAVSALLLVINIVKLYGLYLAWRLERKGWKIVLVLAAIGLLVALGNASILMIAINAIIIWYLYTNQDLFK